MLLHASNFQTPGVHFRIKYTLCKRWELVFKLDTSMTSGGLIKDISEQLSITILKLLSCMGIPKVYKAMNRTVENRLNSPFILKPCNNRIYPAPPLSYFGYLGNLMTRVSGIFRELCIAKIIPDIMNYDFMTSTVMSYMG